MAPAPPPAPGPAAPLQPPAARAGAAAALPTAVGFLPAPGHRAGPGPRAAGAAVSLLAATAAVIQPRAGQAHDNGRLATRTGMAAGLALGATGLALAAFLPGLPGLLGAAITLGPGTALITPLGFAALAASSPEGRLRQTMGAAHVGRELAHPGGPPLVGAIPAPPLTRALALP